MLEHGFEPDFPTGTDSELAAIKAHVGLSATDGVKDLRSLLWSSIDNDTSKDLDQIEWAEQLPDGRIRVLIGVADVDCARRQGTVIDAHAKSETTSVYTGVKVFPMLPVELSEGITSLNENQDRAALVIEYAVDPAGLRPKARRIAHWCATARSWLTTALAHGSRAPDPRRKRSLPTPNLAAQLKLQDAGRATHAWHAASSMALSIWKPSRPDL